MENKELLDSFDKAVEAMEKRAAAIEGRDYLKTYIKRLKGKRKELVKAFEDRGGRVYETEIPADMVDHLDDYSDENYQLLLDSLAAETGGEAKTAPPYPRIYVVINPASGKPQPVLHILNKYFHKFGIKWEIGMTQKYGDATEMARKAATSGEFDLVVGYGGDGTQHEIANGVIGTGVMMGVLPGGTGNGFGTELGVPHDLDAAVRVLCTSHNVRHVDIAQYNEDFYFIQRLFTGIEPEEQTSRADKDKYGTFAYLMRDVNRYKEGKMKDIPYHLTIDGKEIEMNGYKLYVVNSGMAGTGLAIGKEFKIDDGLLDVFLLSSDSTSTEAAVDRFLGLDSDKASMFYWKGKEIVVDADPDLVGLALGHRVGR
jgi:diacylglycerol kinase family enzyme